MIALLTVIFLYSIPSLSLFFLSGGQATRKQVTLCVISLVFVPHHSPDFSLSLFRPYIKADREDG